MVLCEIICLSDNISTFISIHDKTMHSFNSRYERKKIPQSLWNSARWAVCVWPAQGCLHAEGPILEFHLSPVSYVAIVWQFAIVGKWKVRALPPRVFLVGWGIGVCDSCLAFLQVIVLVSGLASHWGKERLHPRFFAWATQVPGHIGKVNLIWYFGDFRFMFRSYFGHPRASV